MAPNLDWSRSEATTPIKSSLTVPEVSHTIVVSFATREWTCRGSWSFTKVSRFQSQFRLVHSASRKLISCAPSPPIVLSSWRRRGVLPRRRYENSWFCFKPRPLTVLETARAHPPQARISWVCCDVMKHQSECLHYWSMCRSWLTDLWSLLSDRISKSIWFNDCHQCYMSCTDFASINACTVALRA